MQVQTLQISEPQINQMRGTGRRTAGSHRSAHQNELHDALEKRPVLPLHRFNASFENTSLPSPQACCPPAFRESATCRFCSVQLRITQRFLLMK
jgi:hypothetical protein